MAKKKIKKKKGITKKTKNGVLEFKQELNNAMLTAMTAAFGFLIALTWRDVIVSYVDKISSKIPVSGRLISAFVVTIICVFGIWIVTKLFSMSKK